jgi:hypothetical protein
MSSPRHHVRAKTSTMVLYQGGNDKPTITLTTYVDGLHARQFKLRLIEPTKPDDGDLITAASLDETFAGASETVDQKSKDLMRELGRYFEELESEFEEKTGIVWTLLRAWANEDWDWTSDEAEDGDSIWAM